MELDTKKPLASSNSRDQSRDHEVGGQRPSGRKDPDTATDMSKKPLASTDSREPADEVSTACQVHSVPLTTPLVYANEVSATITCRDAWDRQLRQVFDEADCDGSGQLSKRQLYHALSTMGLALTASQQLQVWKAYDLSHLGTVSRADFCQLSTLLLVQQSQNGKLEVTRKRLVALFQALDADGSRDADGDGRLSATDLVAAVIRRDP